MVSGVRASEPEFVKVGICCGILKGTEQRWLNEALKDAIVSAPMDERHHPLEILDEAVR
jgi:hypothetical protein